MKKLCITMAAASCYAITLAYSEQMQSESVSAATNQVLQFTFRSFTNSADAGRQAMFRITNITDHLVMGFMGEVHGYDGTGQEVYDFPWSQSRFPELLEAHGSVDLPLGFEIPTNVESAVYEASDFEIIRATKPK